MSDVVFDSNLRFYFLSMVILIFHVINKYMGDQIVVFSSFLSPYFPSITNIFDTKYFIHYFNKLNQEDFINNIGKYYHFNN